MHGRGTAHHSVKPIDATLKGGEGFAAAASAAAGLS